MRYLKDVIVPPALHDSAVNVGVHARALLLVLLPHSLMLTAILVPHYALTHAVSTLKLALINIAVQELPNALGEVRAIKVSIIDLPIPSGIYANAMSLMPIPHTIKDGARPITYLTHAIHDIIIKPSDLHLRVEQPPAPPLLILRSPQHLPLVVFEVKIDNVAIVSLIGPVIAIEVSLSV